MIRIAVASGKGGTGKTLFATNLAWTLARRGLDATYVDADVEAPNGHIFLEAEELAEERFGVPVPRLAGECDGCRECQKACAFNALLALKDSILLFPELCHGCGTCRAVCPKGAIEETTRDIGVVSAGRSGGLRLLAGRLDVGEAKAAPLIHGLLDRLAAEAQAETNGDERIVVIDAPPGASCSAKEAVSGADYVLLVTEPTPFGLHDLELAFKLVRALGVPCGAFLNRSDIGDGQAGRRIEEAGVELLGEAPFDRSVAEAYAAGRLVAEVFPEMGRRFDELGSKLIERARKR